MEDYHATPPPAGAVPVPVECFSSALSTDRADAWRCSTGVRIYDPCFALTPTDLMCQPWPNVGDPGTYARVAEHLPVPASDPTLAPRAWLLSFADGTSCLYATGTAAMAADGRRADYRCDNGEWILGLPDEGPLWRAQVISGALGPNGLLTDPANLRDEPIERAWR